MRRRKRNDEGGLAVVFLALSITSVMLAGAFAVDLGWWYLRAQQAQRAADAASLAGVVWMPNDFAKATAVARESAKTNGFTHLANGIQVIVEPGTNSRQLAVRIVDGNVARFFSSLASKDAVTIGRRAVAQYELPIPLGGPENQFGGGYRGIYLAVNGYCTRRADGDLYSSAYYRTDGGNASISCPTGTDPPPSSPIARNPKYRSTGYTYVVNIPPVGPGCTAVPRPASCVDIGAEPVSIELLDPTLDETNPSPPGIADIYNSRLPFGSFPSCGLDSTPRPRPSETKFEVRGPDDTPLDDSDGLPLVTANFPETAGTSTSWTFPPLYTVPAFSRAGRYLVRVYSVADKRCQAWSNAFGLRARVGGPFTPFTPCTTIPGAPGFMATCPQVHGQDAMSLRTVATTTSASCTVFTGNPCASFFLAQVDPVYAGREMQVTLFDSDEGARKIYILAPNGTRVPFSYKSIDDTSRTPLSGTLTRPGPTLLDVTPPTPAPLPPADPNPFDDRTVQLTVPLTADLSVGGGWFKIEYEVANSTTIVRDRTTWSVNVRGAPVRLVT